jgi:endonuclease-8
VNPFTGVSDIEPLILDRILDTALDLLAANVLTRAQTLSTAVGRRTTRSLDPGAKLWVYGRAGRPCRRCGERIEARQSGADARLTYWCPRCQPPAPGP